MFVKQVVRRFHAACLIFLALLLRLGLARRGLRDASCVEVLTSVLVSAPRHLYKEQLCLREFGGQVQLGVYWV